MPSYLAGPLSPVGLPIDAWLRSECVLATRLTAASSFVRGPYQNAKASSRRIGGCPFRRAGPVWSGEAEGTPTGLEPSRDARD